MSVFLVLPLKRMPTIYSFPLTDAQSPFHSCIQPWTPHISTDTHASLPFLHIFKLTCVSLSALHPPSFHPSVLWKSNISINSVVMLGITSVSSGFTGVIK